MYSCHFSSKKIALSFFTCSLMVLIKVHITPKMFLLKWIQLLFERAVKWKKFWIWLSPRFSIPFQSRVRVLHDPVSGSLGRRLLMTSTQKPNTMAPQSALCICPRKWKAKLIVPIYFGTKTSKFCLRIISFSSLASELHFDLKDSDKNLDRACLTTVKSLLGALRAICNISSDDGEDLLADELLVY